MKDNSIATTWSVTVPMITNSDWVATGEELLLEATPKPAVAGKRKQTTWKDDVARVAKKAKEKITPTHAAAEHADEFEV